MSSHADLLFCEPVRRLGRRTLTELFGPFNLLTYTVLRTQAHPVYGLSSLLAITPISEDEKKRLKYKFITVSDDGRIQKLFDESLFPGLSVALAVDEAIREMDDAVDNSFSKMQEKIAQEIADITPAKGSVKPKKPLTDEELVQLFGQEENQEKKKNEKKKGSKKKSKKKPNCGKTENAIRKTQKPVKL